MLTFDITALERLGENLARAPERLNETTAIALNDSAFTVRSLLIDTWGESVTVRSSHLMSASLRVVKADPTDLEVSIIDVLQKAHLGLHAHGGAKTLQHAAAFAIPTSNTRLTAHGPQPSPRALADSFVKHTAKGPVIYARQGRGKGAPIKAMYVLKTTVSMLMDWPAESIFADGMRNEMAANWPAACIKAILGR